MYKDFSTFELKTSNEPLSSQRSDDGAWIAIDGMVYAWRGSLVSASGEAPIAQSLEVGDALQIGRTIG